VTQTHPLITRETLRERKSFRQGRQVAWDSTSLGSLKRCARYYFLSIVEGWAPKGARVHLDFGGWFHEAMEIFDHGRVADGGLTDEVLVRAVRHMMNVSCRRDEDGRFVGIWESGHESKNLESLIRSVVWYFDHYREDVFEVVRLANGRAAVELSFNFSLPFTLDGEDLAYCGHLDALGKYGGETYFLDRKTTGSALTERFFKQFSPNVQMSGYAFASRVAFEVPAMGGIVDALQIGVGFTRFGRQIILASDSQLDEWLEGTRDYINLAAQFADANRWPMNENACGMYDGCQFLGVCSKSPGVRDRFLESGFERRSWDPLVPR